MNLPEIEKLRGYGSTFIVGAGFSKDFNTQKLPLANDYLKIAKENNAFKPETEHKELLEFIGKYFGDYKCVNIETLASFLMMPLIPSKETKNENRGKLYSDLLEIIVRTVELVHQEPENDEIGNTYRSFVRTLQKVNSQIITFNYDLIIDQCLLDTKEWDPIFGYGFPFRSIEDPTNSTSEEIFDKIRKTNPRTTMCYKLHGSVNWCKSLIPPLYNENSIFLTQSSLRLPILLPVTRHSGGSTLTGDLLVEPFIVPPILSKEDFQKEPILSNIWYRAKEAICRSRYIFILGYSFPPTDFFFEFLLRQARTINRFSDNLNENRVVYAIQKYSDEKLNKDYEAKVKNIFGNVWYEGNGDGTLSFLKNFIKTYANK